MHINTTDLNLRRNLGILGILLPCILVFGNGLDIQPSISHFYYTRMSVFFTGILVTFGLFLFSYRGYDKTGREKLSDNLLTNFAGILAILTALIPTSCSGTDCVGPNSHNNNILGIIHLSCAGGFLAIMGWMSLFKFTKSGRADSVKKYRYDLYIVSGSVVGLMLIILGLEFFTEYKRERLRCVYRRIHCPVFLWDFLAGKK
ncbi:MAG: hypothetical protein MRK02_06940 [Candidatus Scalindua sp.]|nr:hypothetical protein [Candidatus Scalindua sp.]